MKELTSTPQKSAGDEQDFQEIDAVRICRIFFTSAFVGTVTGHACQSVCWGIAYCKTHCTADHNQERA